MGQTGDITTGTTLLAAIKAGVSENTLVRYDAAGAFEPLDSRADIGLVVLSEPPYAEGMGDRSDLALPQTDVALIQRVRPKCRKLVVILYSGRPLIITDHLDKCEAFVAAWLPGTEGQGLADVLFGDYPFAGRLPYTWPRTMDQVPRAAIDDDPLFPFGYGMG
jgi:beta-glucosidase